jgi:hydroxymethylglutaryl-CoA reductase (NADPH)
MTEQSFVPVPLQWVGPIKIVSKEITTDVEVPLATFEKPIWHTVNRGAKISCLCGGINAIVVSDQMTRSIAVETKSANEAFAIVESLRKRFAEISTLIATTSKFIAFKDLQFQIISNLIFIRIACETGDAAGHNMVTKAATTFIKWLQSQYANLKYVSVSGNYCVDKKVSAANGILGRGKHVLAELFIPRDICLKYLRTTPEQIVDINIKKNLLGGIIAGSIRTANAHFANMLLALYLATGQDGANVVEGSQGITFAEIKNDGLSFSVSVPNIIVGTVGSGKELAFVQNNLNRLGCLEKSPIGYNSRKLAIIAGATVLCGELSLLAALTNQEELMRAHNIIER